MLFGQMKNLVMHQTNNDIDDLGDFMPYLAGYLNEGYDRLVQAWDGGHIGDGRFPFMEFDTDSPNLPEWTHAVIVDWATWLMYRNGNPSKQSRGYAFRDAAERMLLQIRGMLNADKGNPSAPRRQIVNIPK
jgi:hypothetical protein